MADKTIQEMVSAILNPSTRQVPTRSDVNIQDSDWANYGMLMPGNMYSKQDKRNLMYSTATNKITNTSFGGNFVINPLPKYTRTCDVPLEGRVFGSPEDIMDDGFWTGSIGSDVKRKNSLGFGYGMYYSEAHDDNMMIAYLKAGFPRFNSALSFYTGAIDYEMSVIASTGRSTVAYNFGRVTGRLVMLAAFPIITLSLWAASTISRALLSEGSYDFYYMEDNMPVYWGIVNNLATAYLTEAGILLPELMPQAKDARLIGMPVKLNADDMGLLRRMFPWLISENNYVDVFAIATRMQVYANRAAIMEYDAAQKNPNLIKDFAGYATSDKTTKEFKSPGFGVMATINVNLMFSKYLKTMRDSLTLYENKGDAGVAAAAAAAKTDAANKKPAAEKEAVTNTSIMDAHATMPKMNPDGTRNWSQGRTEADASWLTKFAEVTDAAARDGGAYVGIRVDHIASKSVSFQNSVGDIQVNAAIKAIGGQITDMKFNLSGGNLAGNMDKMLGIVKDVAAGALDSVTFGLSNVLAAFTAGGFYDIPKKYNDSSFSADSHTFSVDGRCIYNNPISRLQNELLPFFCLMGMAAPLAVGPAGYTSPMLCSLNVKGLQHIKMGMITQLTFESATANLPYDKQWVPLGTSIKFQVTDFSNLVTVAVNPSVFSQFNVQLIDDSPMGRFMAVLASRDLITNKYMWNKMLIKASRLLMQKDAFISPANWGLSAGTMAGKIVGPFVADRANSLYNNNYNAGI